MEASYIMNFFSIVLPLLLASCTASIYSGVELPHTTPQTLTTKKSITVHNKITKDMLGYKYIIMNYPSVFSIKVNDVLIPAGQSQTIAITNNILTVQYEYEFGKRRKGSKAIEFKVPATIKNTDLTFSWNDDWRVKLSNGTPQKKTILE